MTEESKTATRNGAVIPNIEQLPDRVQKIVENEIEGDLQRIFEYTCRNCEMVEFVIQHDAGTEYIVDNEVGDVRMHHLGDTSSSAFHLDGSDADPPYLCDHCFDDVRFRGTQVIGVLPNGKRTGYRVEGRIVTYPYWEFDTAPRKTTLENALTSVIEEETPEFNGKSMVEIQNELSNKRRTTIASGEAGVHAIVYGSWGSVFVPEREVNIALGRGRTVTVDELPDILRIEESTAHYEFHHTAAETAAGFDCTDFGNADTFRQVLEAVDLDPEADHYRIDSRLDPNNEDAIKTVAHIWVNDGVMIQTGNDPLSGEYGKADVGKDSEPGYASLIRIEGREYPVGSLFREIKRHAKDVDGVNFDKRGFL